SALTVPLMLLLYFQAEDGIRERNVTGVLTCALPILSLRFAVPAARSRKLEPRSRLRDHHGGLHHDDALALTAPRIAAGEDQPSPPPSPLPGPSSSSSGGVDVSVSVGSGSSVSVGSGSGSGSGSSSAISRVIVSFHASSPFWDWLSTSPGS